MVAQAPNRGELRLVMNLESLVKSVYFRSYWVQRNVSAVRRYWTGVADVKRSPAAITETRVFLRAPDAAEAVAASRLGGHRGAARAGPAGGRHVQGGADRRCRPRRPTSSWAS